MLLALTVRIPWDCLVLKAVAGQCISRVTNLLGGLQVAIVVRLPGTAQARAHRLASDIDCTAGVLNRVED